MNQIAELVAESLGAFDKQMRAAYEAGKLIIIYSAAHPEQATVYQKLIHWKLTYEQIIAIIKLANGDGQLIDLLVKEALFAEHENV